MPAGFGTVATGSFVCGSFGIGMVATGVMSFIFSFLLVLSLGTVATGLFVF